MTGKLIRFFSGMLIAAFVCALAAIWIGDDRFTHTSFLCMFFGVMGLLATLAIKSYEGSGL